MRAVVIGAGPAGCAAALALRRHGLTVDLLERADRIGGQVVPAALPPGKEDLAPLPDVWARELEAAGVRIHLGVTADADTPARMAPGADLVVLATGSASIRGTIPDHRDRSDPHGPRVESCLELLNGPPPVPGERIVVVGSGLTGLETAQYAEECGATVTVLEEQAELAVGEPEQNAAAHIADLRARHVRMRTSVRVVSIEPGGLCVIAPRSRASHVPADRVVLALGVTPVRALAAPLRARGYRVHVVGDAHEIGNIAAAIASARAAAQTIST